MALIDWNDRLSVNVREIDQQHQKLVAMINELNDAMRERRAKEVLGKIIDGLISYTATHFSTEEKYFTQYQYPETAVHAIEHKNFVKKVTEFKTAFDNDQMMLSIDVINFLRDWLVKHIQGTDKKYGPFLNKKGIT